MSSDSFKVNKSLIIKPRAAKPTSPQIGETIVDANTGKMQYYNSTAWVDINKPETSTSNLITNSSAVGVVNSIFSPYADAAGTRPVDGTGGSPTVSTGLSSTGLYNPPIFGTQSYYLAKGAGNMQGNGWSTAFTVELGSRSKMFNISFDYLNITAAPITPGTSTTDGDMIVYIYDVTNSQLIEPSNIKLFSNSTTSSDKFQATFQTSATGVNYRLIIHLAGTTTTSMGIKLDNVSITPSQYVYAPQITATLASSGYVSGITTNAALTARQRFDGDLVKADLNLFFSGTNTQSSATITVPILVDMAKMPYTNRNRVGSWSIRNPANGTVFSGVANVAPASTGSNAIILLEGFAPNSNVPFTLAANAEMSINLEYPGVGLSAVSQVSDGADLRVVGFKAGKNTTQTLTSSSWTVISAWDVLSFDTNTTFNASTGVYTVQVPGYYEVEAQITYQANATGPRNIQINRNIEALSTPRIAVTVTPNASAETSVQASSVDYYNTGDTIRIYGLQISGGGLSVSTNGGYNSFSATRVSGPQTIAATEEMSLRYSSSSGQTINSSTTTYIYGVRDYDSHGWYNPATGEFKPQQAARYKIKAQVGSTYNAVTHDFNVRIYKNGTQVSVNTKTSPTGSGNTVAHEDTLNLISTDVVTIRTDLNAGSGAAAINQTVNFLTIERVK